MSKLMARVSVTQAGWRGLLPATERTVARAVRAAASGANYRKPALVDVHLADDRILRRLNRAYRGKDMPTNVLSFPLGVAMPGRAPRVHLGDVVVALGTVRREAHAQGKRPADHAVHLVVHGTLHLLGYDHLTRRDAAAMERLEKRVLAGLGIADPYRAPRPARARPVS
ncbi:MAG: rRNA maturation RNase YbeY [Alphaproteobacteria bacterium]